MSFFLPICENLQQKILLFVMYLLKHKRAYFLILIDAKISRFEISKIGKRVKQEISKLIFFRLRFLNLKHQAYLWLNGLFR